ncbi:MAG: phospholipase C, partial [Thermoleophilaceae bacterium]
RLADVEHVVIFVQENRSFDHYFGTYRGVHGFGDRSAAFAQPGYPAPGYGGHLLPFHLDTTKNGECTHDITHDWAPQHRAWNGGAMDGFVREHLAAEGNDGPVTMGYYKRADLAYYYALADAFTLCDRYFCSVLGPTDPNQLMLISGTLDPDGRAGGPMLETTTQRNPRFSWTTMPEQLRARGISWRVYTTPDNLSPEGDTPLTLFTQYASDSELAAGAFSHQYPADFQADCASGSLPAVSWIWGPVAQSEHPPAPPAWGEYTTDQILRALTSNPDLWAKTALFVTWDENGGFFDHVAPPVPPPGTRGEYLPVNPLPDVAQGIAGPLGLGFRVPLLVLSPFSRGGLVSSDVFDHTSLLRFIEARFAAEVPNLSAWRRSAVGDLTSAFNFVSPDRSVPLLPATSLTDPAVIASNCTSEPATLGGAPLPPYPVPPNSMPSQEPGSARRPSGLPCAEPVGGSGPSGAQHHRRRRRRHHRRRRRLKRHHR